MRVAVPVALAALAIVVGGVLRGTDRAEALSCVGPEVVLVGAERAFIGALVAEDGDRLEFDVTEPGRGEVPDPVVVRDELAGSGWPLARELEPGQVVGVVVRTVDGEPVTNQCLLVDPARLREARDGGWPEGAAQVGSPRARVVAGVARVEVGCFGRCRGHLTLRAAGGRRLGGAPVDLTRAGTVAVRLRGEARRRLARHGRLPARATVRLAPGGPARSAAVTLLARRP
jgi:hypothetical protein